MFKPPCPYLVCGQSCVSPKFPKPKNFEISMGELTLPQSNQDPCQKIPPPHSIHSLMCSSRYTNPCVPIWTVASIVGPQNSPNTKNFEIPVWEHLSPYTEASKNLLKKNPPPGRIHNLTPSFISLWSHVYSLSVGGSVAAQSWLQSHLDLVDFRAQIPPYIWETKFPPAPTIPEHLRKIQPPNSRCSLTSSFTWYHSHFHILSLRSFVSQKHQKMRVFYTFPFIG